MTTVLFDLYGTLFVPCAPRRQSFDWQSYLLDYVRGRGTATPEELLAEHLNELLDRSLLPETIDPKLSVFENRLAGFFRDAAVEISSPELSRLAGEVCGGWQNGMALDRDVPDLLSRLQATVSLGLVSNYDHPPHVRAVLSGSGIARFFRWIIVSGEEGTSKPDPGIFRRVLDSDGVDARETLYVGDSLVDYQAASAAGITPLIIRREAGEKPGVRRDARAGDTEAETLLLREARAGRVRVIGSLRDVLTVVGQG